jgi:hypothetical protein
LQTLKIISGNSNPILELITQTAVQDDPIASENFFTSLKKAGVSAFHLSFIVLKLIVFQLFFLFQNNMRKSSISMFLSNQKVEHFAHQQVTLF